MCSMFTGDTKLKGPQISDETFALGIIDKRDIAVFAVGYCSSLTHWTALYLLWTIDFMIHLYNLHR